MRGIRWVIVSERVEDRPARYRSGVAYKPPVRSYRHTKGGRVAPRMVYRMRAVDTTKYTADRLRELRKEGKR